MTSCKIYAARSVFPQSKSSNALLNSIFVFIMMHHLLFLLLSFMAGSKNGRLYDDSRCLRKMLRLRSWYYGDTTLRLDEELKLTIPVFIFIIYSIKRPA